METAPPEEGAGEHEPNADQLHQRNAIVEHQRTAGISAEKFNRASLDAVEHEVSSEHLACETLAFGEPNEEQKIKEFGGGFIQLRWVQRNAQRSARDSTGDLAGEGDAPGQRRRLAVAAASREAAKTANGMAEGQSDCKSVQHGEHRHLLKMCVQDDCQNAAEKAAVKCSTGLKRLDTENFPGIRDVKIPSAENQPELRDNHGGENDVDTQIPNFLGAKARARGVTAGVPNSEEDAGCDQNTVAIDRDRAELEENGMHRWIDQRQARSCVGCLPW